MVGQRLLDRVREVLRLHQYSLSTEKAYVEWIRRYILFHGKTHPNRMGKSEVEAFLTHLAANLGVAPSTESGAGGTAVPLHQSAWSQPALAR